MKMPHVKFLTLSLVVFLFLNSWTLALAQEKPRVYFSLDNNNFAPDSEFIVDIFINSKEPINAIDLEMSYPIKNLELLQVNNSRSIIDIWRSSPVLHADGTLRIEGGLSKPFYGQKGGIVSLYFKAKDGGLVQLSFLHINIYYADGLGTRAEVDSLSTHIGISADAPKTTLAVEDDSTPPLLAKVEVVKDPITQSMLAVFNVSDKESGIKAAFIRWKKWFFWSDWQAVTNPASIPQSVWVFQIKAVDNGGNATLQTVYATSNIMMKIIYSAVLLLFIFMLILIVRFAVIRQKKISV